MIVEALAWLATPCPPLARRLGLLSESIAISARHRRCRDAWAPHLAATRAAILDAVARTRSRRTVVVMGSGALLDLPLAELAAAFRRVVLVDLVHPWRARRLASRFRNVTLITDDVTGALEDCLTGGLSAPRPFSLLDDEGIDLAISLNLLSQLPLAPVRKLEGRVPDAALAAFAQALIRGHLADLEGCGATALLVADVERVVTDRGGREVERLSLIADLPEPVGDRTWWWDIAPAPEADPETSERRRVISRLVPGAFERESL
jgi:hypothetical protein